MPLFRKGTPLYGIIHCKCPKCQQGDLFIHTNHYHLDGLLDMPDSCPVCGRDLQIEPGFYLGAMWVSYPIVMFLIIGSLLLAHYVLRLHLIASFVFAGIVLAILTPPLLRYSRVLFLYLFAEE